MLKLFLPSVCYAIISNRHTDFNTLLGHVKVLLNGFFRQNRLAALFLMVSWKLVFHLTNDFVFVQRYNKNTECIWRSKKERRPPRMGELCRRRREYLPPETGIPDAPAGG